MLKVIKNVKRVAIRSQILYPSTGFYCILTEHNKKVIDRVLVQLEAQQFVFEILNYQDLFASVSAYKNIKIVCSVQVN